MFIFIYLFLNKIKTKNKKIKNMFFDNLVSNKYKKWLTLTGSFFISSTLGVWR